MPIKIICEECGLKLKELVDFEITKLGNPKQLYPLLPHILGEKTCPNCGKKLSLSEAQITIKEVV
jgi:hypothetical protein